MAAESAAVTVILVMAYAFLWGLRRGSVACLAVCGPALMERSAAKGGGWRRGVRWALVFNAPRVAILTAFGAVAGATAYAAFAAGSQAGTGGGWALVPYIAAAAYFIAGAALVIYGMITFARAMEERSDILEGFETPDLDGGNCARGRACGLSRVLPGEAGRRAAMRLLPKGRDEGFLAAWGLLLGFACLGETAIAMEAALVGGAVGSAAGGAALAAVLGAAAMFLFGLGASLPLILASGLCAHAVEKSKRRKLLTEVRMGGGAAMMAIGSALCLLFGPALFTV